MQLFLELQIFLALINNYKPYLKKSIGINYLLFYLVAIIPENFLKILKEIYYKRYIKH
jgi:hypothetical protein